MRYMRNFLFLFFAAAASAVFAQEEKSDLSNESCFECHSDSELTGEDVTGKAISLFVDPKKYATSVHGSNDCISCHESISEIPHEEALKKVECGSCHSDESEKYSASSHGKAMAAGKKESPDCFTCHGKHDILSRTDPQSKIHPLNQIEICTSCHMDPEVIEKSHLPRVDQIQDYKTGVHGRGVLRSGLLVSATCVSCHTAHGVLPKTDPASTIHKSRIPETCGSCHLGILEDFRRSEHGKMWKKNSEISPGCVTCHGAHGILDPITWTFHQRIPLLCAKCHEKEAPTYQDTFHGKALTLGFVRSATCADCHTAHLNLKKEDPQSSVHPNHLQENCGKCHAETSASFTTFDPHSDPEDKGKSPLLYYIYHAMVGLLYSVFGFFTIHTILWLQRSVTAYIRKELPSYHHSEGPWIMRFSMTDRIVHGFVMISFLGLAFTGIPIRFPYSGWNQILVNLSGGIEVFRFFHRFFAVITFGYAFFHLGHLVSSVWAGKKGMLYGPGSMIPRPGDFRDLLQQIRWFLYLGKPARLDRWTYWEKFDYFAVFWGIPVIGISGLMLWFPGFFTKFLPGYALNIAKIVHSEEAMLAVGFIFVFHFFHTHLRAESFPMDLVIFTGSMPLNRFQEERQDEYKRLKACGELEKRLVPPPDSRTIRRAYIIGTTGLASGLILIVVIILSVLFLE